MEKFNGFGIETQEERERRISSVEVIDGGEVKVCDFNFEVSKRELNDHRFLMAIYGSYERCGFMRDLQFAFSYRLVLQEKMKAYFKHNYIDADSVLTVFDIKTGIELEYTKVINNRDEIDSVTLADAIWKALEGVLKSIGEDLGEFVDEVI